MEAKVEKISQETEQKERSKIGNEKKIKVLLFKEVQYLNKRSSRKRREKTDGKKEGIKYSYILSCQTESVGGTQDKG